ncbi:hypothetical protein EYF80_050863 [Liparis tanakae]|uniref:Uncharacterized protein n=1 Tax=Liparis tanakae TaxID=230148 RepID=A0A4Z2FCK1_9TELE|nr:hypothetical protein EYF80_050863 [Liparis tanakae]
MAESVAVKFENGTMSTGREALRVRPSDTSRCTLTSAASAELHQLYSGDSTRLGRRSARPPAISPLASSRRMSSEHARARRYISATEPPNSSESPSPSSTHAADSSRISYGNAVRGIPNSSGCSVPTRSPRISSPTGATNSWSTSAQKM